MIIKLERNVHFEKYKVVIELGRNQAREDIIAVLMLAQENNDQITADLICTKLLGGRPKAMGELIINRCKELGLFSEENQLTDLGVSSIESDKVFIPEYGLYQIWVTQDPLIPQKLLDLRAVEFQSLRREILNEKNEKENGLNDKENIIDIPEWILGLKNEVINLFGSSKDRIQIINMETKGESLTKENNEVLRTVLTIPIEKEISLSLSGLYDTVLDPPSFIFDRIWNCLLGNKIKDWDKSTKPPKLRFGFNELNEIELNNFKKDIEFLTPSIQFNLI